MRTGEMIFLISSLKMGNSKISKLSQKTKTGEMIFPISSLKIGK
jgi:hypothetical protein